jgi:type III restriction enzyme
LTGGAGLFRAAPPPTVIDLAEDLSAFDLTPEERATVTIEKTEQGSRVTFTGNVAEETVSRLAGAVQSYDTRANLESEAKRHKAVWQQHASPAQRGIPFRVPQLCFDLDGALELAEKAAFLDASVWSLLDYPAEIAEADFRLTDTGVQWEVDLNAAGKLTEKAIGKADQFDLDLVDTGWTEQQLCRWLERKARQQDITQVVLLEFVRRNLAYLTEKRALPLTVLVRWKFILAKVLAQKIGHYREQASETRKLERERVAAAEMADARARDVALHQAGIARRMPGVLVGIGVAGAVLTVAAMLAGISLGLPEGGAVMGALIAIAVGFLGIVKDAAAFEFGSSFGSRCVLLGHGGDGCPVA